MFTAVVPFRRMRDVSLLAVHLLVTVVIGTIRREYLD
jgi:hypothetical protein